MLVLKKSEVSVGGLGNGFFCLVQGDTTAAPTRWWNRWITRNAWSRNVAVLEVKTDRAFRIGYFQEGVAAHTDHQLPWKAYELTELLNRSAKLGELEESEVITEAKMSVIDQIRRPVGDVVRWPHVTVPLIFEDRSFFAIDDQGNAVQLRLIRRSARKDGEYGLVVAI